MRLFQRFQRGELPLTRIEAFSDGVFAIVVTLLVLDLKVPDLGSHVSAPELARALLALSPRFLSWVISFIIVCKFWLNQHHVLSLARHADYALVWWNAIFLMFQSLVPFPTAVMGDYPTNPLAVSFFGVVMALNSALFIAMHAYVLRRLLRPEYVGTGDPRIILKSCVGPLGYLLGAAGAWEDVRVAFVVYALTPLCFIVPPPNAAAVE